MPLYREPTDQRLGAHMHGHVTGAPRAVLRLEGIAVLITSLVGYAVQGGSWLLLPVVLFLPDLLMVGYMASTRLGATVYNLGHTYVMPCALAVIGAAVHDGALLTVACVWAAHIGMDRALGYGLKYPDAFRNTHLGIIGR